MASAAQSDVQYIQRLIPTYLNGTAANIVDRSPGFSGSRVYAVDVATATGQRPCIVKLVPDWGDEHTWPVADQLTNWVYGGHAAGFGATYTLLQHHAIPLPHVYAALAPQPDVSEFTFLLERVAGDDVERVRTRLRGPALARFDAVVGAQLGTLHRITRAFAGWADQPTETTRPWRETFFAAFAIILERACVHAALAQRRQQLEHLLAQYAEAWRDPASFVLSHGDGFQAMVARRGTGWTVSGVIDIEDHRFTDARFALAVYELEAGRIPLGEAFWAAYLQHRVLESDYEEVRPLYQLYVLLDWLGNVPATQPDTIRELLEQIDSRSGAADG